jgi:predicted enzyme related to lactoylglutathione lyase
MEKVTGIGGVFIKAKDVTFLAAWYQKHLGIEFGDNSYVDFKWLNKDLNTPGHTVFSFFKEDTSYFSPSEKPFMINFRVKDLDVLLAELKKEGVEIVGEKEEYEYGNFGWIMDPEGNKIELWQPIDEKL